MGMGMGMHACMSKHVVVVVVDQGNVLRATSIIVVVGESRLG